MKESVFTYNFNDNFINKAVNFILNNYFSKERDYSKIACIFGGRRPALFLHKNMAECIGKSFIPPRFFSIDDFIDYIIEGDNPGAISDLDAAFLIYNLAKKQVPDLLDRRSSFAEFLPWAKEIVSFVEQLDLEFVEDKTLVSVEKSAAIGYEIPSSINKMLENIICLRKSYHKELNEKNKLSRGMKYLKAATRIKALGLDEFEKIIFCNFFYLHDSERRIIKDIHDRGKAVLLFQGSQEDWPVLKSNARALNCSIKTKPQEKIPDFSLYQGFDIHSQVGIAKEILETKIDDKNGTVIVLPRSEVLIPLLVQISPVLDKFNVSMGYSLKRTSLYSLFSSLNKVQESKKDDAYYMKDYLELLRHPLIKNIRILAEPVMTRVLIHKIEDILAGDQESDISGSLFLNLEAIESESKIYTQTSKILNGMDINVEPGDCSNLLKEIHDIFLRSFEAVDNFNLFSQRLEKLAKLLIERSPLGNFSFNIKALEKLYDLIESFANCSFNKEDFSPEQIWDIFQQSLNAEKISFIGSPLAGTQILGLFETRSLNFENVIILDVNESIFPKLKVYEPLIPREVMLNLGLNRLEKEEEIQRYQFMRLISAAQNVHIVYQENQENEKSRFIEELLWLRQKKNSKIQSLNPPKGAFSLKITKEENRVKKTPEIIDFLKKQTYSASRVNTYLNCPLQFYYQYVLGLKEKEDLLAIPESSHIGTFIHEFLEKAFSVFKGKKPIIDEKYRKYFFNLMKEEFENTIRKRMKSDSFLLEKIIEKRMEKFLENEAQREVSKIICLEEQKQTTLKIGDSEIDFRYTVDRIDKLYDKSILIIDYKTGSIDSAPKKLKQLQEMSMNRESIKENIKSFQLPLYCYFVSRDYPDSDVNAQLYSIRNLETKSLISYQAKQEGGKIIKISLKALEHIFSEIFNPDIDFIPDKDERKCNYCPFAGMCG